MFEVVLYTMGETLEIALQIEKAGGEPGRQQMEPSWTRVHIWADLQAPIKRLQYTDPGPGQWLAGHIIRNVQQLAKHGITVELHWVPG